MGFPDRYGGIDFCGMIKGAKRDKEKARSNQRACLVLRGLLRLFTNPIL